MGLLDLLLTPPPPPHGPDPDPYLAREGLQLLLSLLVPGHVAKPRLEMQKTSLPLSHPSTATQGCKGRDTPET